MVAHDIRKALQEMAIACEVIQSAGKCKVCPMKNDCFEDVNLVDMKLDEAAISRMLCMAEMITERQEEAEKTEYDRRWEAEADRWNDKRCDPDYED